LEKYGRYTQPKNIKCNFDLKKGDMDDDDVMVMQRKAHKNNIGYFPNVMPRCRQGVGEKVQDL
jgi:hypothetical protein